MQEREYSIVASLIPELVELNIGARHSSLLTLLTWSSNPRILAIFQKSSSSTKCDCGGNRAPQALRVNSANQVWPCWRAGLSPPSDWSEGVRELCKLCGPWEACLFVCLYHRLFTPASTPMGMDFSVHGHLYSRRKGSHAPSSGRFDMHAENLSV